ncbi:epimerase [Faecalicatena contorta]|uniref:epimerase n=1 Tax=Faecalicatena contorta TaxID=39482 RepID=UPI00129D36E1|nr:epimerase [Faecalicatena contorta]MRM91201.1 epimerase [Faecalicatena contorta]
MDILILGGTGAMGIPLVDFLSKENQLYVTTRSCKENQNNIKYLQGNAKDTVFFNSLMNRDYDAIVDFMVYSTEELGKRLPSLLDHTKQYFFFSSSRCYADSSTLITENSPRLVDVCTDPEYLAIDEYGMAKGREENLLFNSGKTNWTIIRPYITYNTNRIQLGVYEKENWLKRALEGRTIVFPKDIASKMTSLTYGPDVAGTISKLIGNEKAIGQAFHITTEESYTWGEVLDFYCDKIEEITGTRPKVKLVNDSNGLMTVWNKWQIKYDRLFSREFDNSKIESVRGRYEYKLTFKGLGECLEEFISNPKWLGMNAKFEAWCDRQCGEWTPLKEIPGKKAKLVYLKCRIFG